MSESPLLAAVGLSVRHGPRIVLESTDIAVARGETLAVYGPNGAGKSTLLQALAGLLPLTSGIVSFVGRTLGRDLTLLDFHRQTAAVFQEPLLLRGTVAHNVGLGLKLRGVAPEERERRVRPWLERLGIGHLAARPAGALSGGEAQRASLARALVLEPQALFLDEPFAALDAPTRARLAEELADILAERQIATLFVTHDFAEAGDLAHRCVVIDGGRVLQDAPFDELIALPASRRVAEIIGAENIFEATVTDADAEGLVLDWNGHRLHAQGLAATPPGTQVGFALRPDRLTLGIADDGAAERMLPGEVVRIRRQGSRPLLTIKLDHLTSVRMLYFEEPCPQLGAHVKVSVPADAVTIFAT